MFALLLQHKRFYLVSCFDDFPSYFSSEVVLDSALVTVGYFDGLFTSLSTSLISLAKLVSEVSGRVAYSELDISFFPLSLYFTCGAKNVYHATYFYSLTV